MSLAAPKAQEAFNLVSEIRPRWFYENGGTKGKKKRDKEERRGETRQIKSIQMTRKKKEKRVNKLSR
jgi:hypothetical protein